MAVGMLYIVATPLGNLEDITLRALRVLKEVDLIAAEDTRRTRKLLTHFQIKTPLTSYHAHNQEVRGPELIEKLRQGQKIALVSDAGTPGFSDPGTLLTDLAWEAGIRVEAVPGPAAAVAALSMSGFPGAVTFLGFPPRKAGKRREFFEALAREPRVLIFYESPRRLAATLAEMAQVFPDRRVLVVRELTKVFEEAWRGQVSEVAALLATRDLKGECTIVLAAPRPSQNQEPDVAATLLTTAQATGLSGRRLADRVAAALNLPRRRVYQTYLELKNRQQLP